ncbi:hypothetical protein GGR57DRAFT_378191 [Xylariaceae sp. FL1272]|nr:hypothetical protein GGR57DRAFT_378191 [Xylariaceae sp. FL1272]
MQRNHQDGKGRKSIIFTHYSPTTDDQATNLIHRRSKIQPRFVTDSSPEACWTSEVVKLWEFGHTHYNYDVFVEEGRLRVLANQKGYYGDRANGFDTDKIVEMSFSRLKRYREGI